MIALCAAILGLLVVAAAAASVWMWVTGRYVETRQRNNFFEILDNPCLNFIHIHAMLD